MGIFDGVSLTHKEKIERNMVLPNVLNIYDIAKLWSNDKREQNIYMEAMYNAFKLGEINGRQCKKDNDGLPVISPYTIYYEVEINKNDFRTWLDSNEEVLSEACLLINWCPSDVKEEKQLGNADKKRLESLRLFVAYVWVARGNTGEPKLPYSFPCEKKSIHSALQEWESARVNSDGSTKKWGITFSTFSDFWKDIKERKEICTGIGRGEDPDSDFFKNIKY